MKDYGTRNVELAWMAPFRKYAPAALVLCVVLLLAVAVVIPISGTSLWTVTTQLLLVVIFSALATLAAYLFISTGRREQTRQVDLESAQELYGLSERLHTTLRSLGEGVISTDVDGLVTLMNDVAVQLTGWPPSRALGLRSSEVFRVVAEQNRRPQDDPAKLVLTLGKRIREDAHAILLARDGGEHPVAYNAAPILDTDGWMIGTVIVFHDVTDLRAMERHREQLIGELSKANEQLRAEISQREEARRAALSLMQDAQLAQQALRESEQRLRVLFEGIQDALVVHDADGRILDCNQAACARLGYTREEMLELSLRDVQPEPENEALGQRLMTSVGGVIPVHTYRSVIRYHGREALLTVARDITELKKAQDELRTSNEQLRESNAALEEYARVASHDLQEPLRKIESFSEVLIEDYGTKLDEEGRVYLDIMVDAARRMRRLIRDVLAFSRAGTAEKPFAPVDLNPVLAVVKDNLSERIQEKKAQVVVGHLPTVHADETQMIQLFQNLVSNGLKFNTSPTPRVEVVAVEDGDLWKILVKDNGIGMRLPESRTIFAPFKRLHTREEYDGTGIGLAICRRIVARHGGAIGVDSTPGKGSTFWLTLPWLTDPLLEQAGKKEKASDTNKGETP
ncbi:MAG: PAS domain S-box protein [Verrucomicrobiota bacterium]